MAGNKVIFFTGAGASKEFGIPFLNQIVDKISSKIKKELHEYFEYMREEYKSDLEEILVRLHNLPAKDYIELFLRTKLNYYLDKKGKFKASSESGNIEKEIQAVTDVCESMKKEYDLLREKISPITDICKKVVYQNCAKPRSNDSTRYWHEFFERLENFIGEEMVPYTVFTTNYDLILELFCKTKKISCITGFGKNWVGNWNPKIFDNISQLPDRKLILFKLHGSLNWYYDDDEKMIKAEERLGGKDIRGRELTNWLLYPGGYQDWTKEPYIELLYRFRQLLNESRYIIVIGYSFRDPFIQDVLINGFIKNKQLEMILIDPNADDLIKNKLHEIKERIRACPKFFGKREELGKLVNCIKENMGKLIKLKVLYFEPLGTKFDEIARNRNWIIVKTETELQNYIKNCNILILFLHEETGKGLKKGLNEDLQRKIVKYVESGGYLIAFHDVLFTRNHILSEELCGHFRRLIKKDEEIEVSVRHKHPITQDISSFKIKDEVWEEIIPAERSGEGIEILFSTSQDQPIGWIREYGKGEVFVFALGHHKEIIENKNIQKIIFNAVEYFPKGKN